MSGRPQSNRGRNGSQKTGLSGQNLQLSDDHTQTFQSSTKDGVKNPSLDSLMSLQKQDDEQE